MRSSAATRKQEKEILYTYVSKTNQKLVSQLARRYNQPLSYVVDQILTSVRTKKPMRLETRVHWTER
jgi:predicted site-specific integrase-resolvase